MRITSKGQVTIPAQIREQAGLLPNTEVAFQFDGDSVRLVKVEPTKGPGRGALITRRLQGSATVKMSTDEIMRLTRSQ